MQAVQAVTLATWFCDVCTKWPQSPNKRRFVIKVCDADQLLDPYCYVAHGGVRRVPMVPGEENQSIIEAKGKIMKLRFNRLSLAFSGGISVAVLTLVSFDGGRGGAAETNVSTTMVSSMVRQSMGAEFYVQRLARLEGGVIARWNANSQPRSQSKVIWSGVARINWPLNCESTSAMTNGRGNSVHLGCKNAWIGESNRSAGSDISGPGVTWGTNWVSVGQMGTNQLSATPSSWVIGKSRFLQVFTGGDSNEVTDYNCQARQVTGFTLNCVPTGVKARQNIATLGTRG